MSFDITRFYTFNEIIDKDVEKGKKTHSYIDYVILHILL